MVPMGSIIVSTSKGLMEDIKCDMDMEGAPLGGKRAGEVLGMISWKNIMVGLDKIDTKKVYVYQLLWSCC
jgi:hypothetical protein